MKKYIVPRMLVKKVSTSGLMQTGSIDQWKAKRVSTSFQDYNDEDVINQ